MQAAPSRGRFAALTLGSLGVVFGDIGTSPIYGFKTAITAAANGGAVSAPNILGVVSLVLWALIMVVTVKYVLFLMRADNKGEGGILSLMTLAQAALGGRTRTVLSLGVIGVALFYGDAIITPAISVLSAVEGLKTAPYFADKITPGVEIASALVLLVGLFLFQSRGTEKVGAWFGPTCLVWFIAIAATGLLHIGEAPEVFTAFNPWLGVHFLLTHGVVGALVLGAVSLTITGAEALYADMGHFGRGPINWAWMAVVFPALAINYMGQGAAALHFIATAGVEGAKDRDWFFLMTPEILRVPMVILSVLATIIASQAVISGAYSLSHHAMQLGLLPNLQLKQTSEHEAGQIYLPTVNLLLMVGVILLVGIFKDSDHLEDAYGFAVTGTMSVTTMLAAVVVHKRWGWSIPMTALVVAPLTLVDLTLFGANSLKLTSGGWVPLTIAAGMIGVIATWIHGSNRLTAVAHKDRMPLKDFIAALARRPRPVTPGTAVFLASDPNVTPSALMHNLKHNGGLHQANVIVTVKTADAPRVAAEQRVEHHSLGEGFTSVLLNFGYMEQPNVPQALAEAHIPGVDTNPMRVSYFLGRRSVVPSHEKGLSKLEDGLFMALTRNSADPSEVFSIPPGRVVEMGVQVAI